MTADDAARSLRAGRATAVSGVLFDLDGTLVDSIPAVESAWALWASEHGIALPGVALHGLTARALIARLGVPDAGRAAAAARLSEIESRPGQRLEPTPGARALIEALPHGRWTIVTSATRAVAESRLHAAGLPVPDPMITGDDVSRGKPDPEPYAAGRAALALPADPPPLAFEDTVAGATAARAAGCLTIGVVGTEKAPDLAAAAHIVISTLDAVTAVDGPDGLRIRLVAEAAGEALVNPADAAPEAP